MQVVRNFTSYTPQACVATIGFFDGVHSGHRFLIDQLKTEAHACGLPSAIITFAVHPRQVLQPSFQCELLTTLSEKLELLERAGVDICFVLDFTPDMAQFSAYHFMQHVLKHQCGVARLLIGHDHRFGRNRSEGFDQYVDYGKEIGMVVSQTKAFSIEGVRVCSSLIRKLLHTAHIFDANTYLGYPYFMKGCVVGGYQMGRKIGFPTANLEVNDVHKIIPKNGVYAAWVKLDDATSHAAMLNIGHRPTLNNGSHRTIEIHILNFDGDLYGKSLQLSFIHFLRSEMKFDSVDALIGQLRNDAAQTAQLLDQ